MATMIDEAAGIIAAVLQTIRQAWMWTGLKPDAITASNSFGNVIVRAVDGAFWRICPEELSCDVVAATATEFEQLWASEAFQVDWQMAPLVSLAIAKLGPLRDDRCYCLKVPAIFGGAYSEENLGTISRLELIACAGEMARQLAHGT